MKTRRLLLAGGAAALFLALTAEVGLRLLGAGDFPLYRTDPVVGYAPVESQAGAYLRRPFAFNALGMGVTQEFRPDPRRGVLLLGDSVVAGGTWLKQDERLGPRLEQRLGADVWPTAAGSWGLANALAYLRLHPEVEAGVSCTILVLNSQDFGAASHWRADAPFHARKPGSVLIDRIALQLGLRRTKPGPKPTAEWRALWPPKGEIVVVLYPFREQLEDPAGRSLMFSPAKALAAPNVRIFDLAVDPRWTAAQYRDDGVHPHAAGTALLAEIIAERVRSPAAYFAAGAAGR